jgi:hypothetical protein
VSLVISMRRIVYMSFKYSTSSSLLVVVVEVGTSDTTGEIYKRDM